MEAKEKAKELIEKFIEPTKVPNIKNIWVEDTDAAKQCALIAVDEILESIQKVFVPLTANLNSTYIYWQKVKEEIEKL